MSFKTTIKVFFFKLQLNAKCTFGKDVLKGDETTEIKIEIAKEIQGEDKEKK